MASGDHEEVSIISSTPKRNSEDVGNYLPKNKLLKKIKAEGGSGKERKPRRPTFKRDELKLLVRVVGTRRSILESKTTSRDIKDINRKAAAWKQVEIDYNSGTVHVQRSIDELKKKWENLKSEAKSEAAKRKKSLTQTGGGKAEPDSLLTDEVLLAVEDIIKGAMEPVTSQFDSNVSQMASSQANTFIDVDSIGESSLIDEKMTPLDCYDDISTAQNIEEIAPISAEDSRTPSPDQKRDVTSCQQKMTIEPSQTPCQNEWSSPLLLRLLIRGRRSFTEQKWV